MKPIQSLLLVLGLALIPSFSSAADGLKPTTKQKPEATTATVQTEITKPAFSSGFIIPSEHLLKLGKLTLANTAKTPADLQQIAAGLNKSQWHPYCIMISKTDGVHASYFLVPTAGQSSGYGMISLTGLTLDEKGLVSAATGHVITFIFDEKGLSATIPGVKEPHLIVSKDDLTKAQASLKPGAGKVVSFNK